MLLLNYAVVKLCVLLYTDLEIKLETGHSTGDTTIISGTMELSFVNGRRYNWRFNNIQIKQNHVESYVNECPEILPEVFVFWSCLYCSQFQSCVK